MAKWTIKKQAENKTYEEKMLNEIKEADERIKELKKSIDFWERHKIDIQNQIKKNKDDSENPEIKNKVQSLIDKLEKNLDEWNKAFNDLKQQAGVSNLRNLIVKYNKYFTDKGEYPKTDYYDIYKDFIEHKQYLNMYLKKYKNENDLSDLNYNLKNTFNDNDLWFNRSDEKFTVQYFYNKLLKMVDFCKKHNIK